MGNSARLFRVACYFVFNKLRPNNYLIQSKSIGRCSHYSRRAQITLRYRLTSLIVPVTICPWSVEITIALCPALRIAIATVMPAMFCHRAHLCTYHCSSLLVVWLAKLDLACFSAAAIRDRLPPAMAYEVATCTRKIRSHTTCFREGLRDVVQNLPSLSWSFACCALAVGLVLEWAVEWSLVPCISLANDVPY